MVEHKSVFNLIRWHQSAFALTPTDRGTQIASPGFDAAVWEIWPYLTMGASVHIPPEEIRADPIRLRDWLLANEITLSFAPTALAEALISVRWPSRSPLRSLLTGGDALLRSPPPGLPFELVNNYGVTEATVVSTSGVVSPSDEKGLRPSLGHPITGVSVQLVDANLRRVAQGEEGEIVVAGPSVARGYLNRPDLTEARFLNVQGGGDVANLVYRTGDLARWRENGELEFIGRLDDQVTIRGVRVEPGEIAAVLNTHPAVGSSVVMVIGDARGQQLVACMVPEFADLPDVELLRSHLCQRLPEAMLPTSYVWRDDLPLSASGKIDRDALSASLFDNSADRQPSPPRNETEQVVAELVADLLGVETLGIDENFFLLGGHSLMGAQLLARLSELFDVELSLRALFDHPTVIGLADEIEHALLADILTLSDDEAEGLLRELVGGD